MFSYLGCVVSGVGGVVCGCVVIGVDVFWVMFLVFDFS